MIKLDNRKRIKQRRAKCTPAYKATLPKKKRKKEAILSNLACIHAAQKIHRNNNKKYINIFLTYVHNLPMHSKTERQQTPSHQLAFCIKSKEGECRLTGGRDHNFHQLFFFCIMIYCCSDVSVAGVIGCK